MRWMICFAALATLVAGAMGGCSTKQAPLDYRQALFEGSIDALAPFRHGNTYTYIVRTDGADDRVVESRCSIAGSRIFVTITEGLKVLARTEMVVENDAILLVSEISPQHDIAFTYDPPLPVLTAPLYAGVERATADLRAWKPSDGSEISQGSVRLTWSAHPAPLSMQDATFEIRGVKHLTLDNGRTVRIQSKRWLAPGVGEISSSGTLGDSKVEYRELACANIAGQRYGDCGVPIVRGDLAP